MNYLSQRGLGEVVQPTPADDSLNLFGFNVPSWLIVVGVVGVFVAYSGGKSRGARKRYDELGNEITTGERFYIVSYTSPDAEYIYDREVSARSEKQAIARMKEWAKEEGHPTRGAQWDADQA
jgi:hypothetical protein